MVSTNNISFNNKVYSNNNTNLLNKFKTPPANQNKTEADTVVLDKDLIADLHFSKDYAAVGTVFEGPINNKHATLKLVTNENKDGQEGWFEGAIDKKYFIMNIKEKKCSGKYGNTEYELNIDYNKPSKISKFINQKILGKAFIPDYFTVTGTIGNKNINLTLPNIKIPADEETKDILSLVLYTNGLKAQTINGEIKTLQFSNTHIKSIKKRAEKREKTINNDIKPIFMQGISSATGLIIGSLVSAMLLKFGLKR